jgi:hypothetical protein
VDRHAPAEPEKEDAGTGTRVKSKVCQNEQMKYPPGKASEDESMFLIPRPNWREQ